VGFEIVNENGRSNPRAFCDHCKQVIVSSGNVEWEFNCQGEPHRHTLQLLHKPCSRLVDSERKAKGLPRTLWMPLDHFLVYLSNGLEMDWEESAKHAGAIAAAF
jgi:hypothetical protein